MSDRLDKLESELAAMRPCALPRELESRVGNAIESPRSGVWADRCLLSAMAMGAMAACVIVGILVQGAAVNAAPGPTQGLAQMAPSPDAYPLLMARANPTGLDELK